ncbi:hypothetical protein L53_04230 [Hyphomonas sp. L-53-1-40]|uniref:integrase core domain-containing protein n=1 Tax=Hyphomonas sp. L-53-1-40 TaxID=1207058 RepID=UPI000458D920|nr:hypothetical protein L53_04230 [Hyphomonas sp. L-53-1-40]
MSLRREILNAEWFVSLDQAQTVINTWLKQYNRVRPHQALGMRPPVPETLMQSGLKMGAGHALVRGRASVAAAGTGVRELSPGQQALAISGQGSMCRLQISTRSRNSAQAKSNLTM